MAAAREGSDGGRRFRKVNSSAVIVNTGNGRPTRSVCKAATTLLFQERERSDSDTVSGAEAEGKSFQIETMSVDFAHFLRVNIQQQFWGQNLKQDLRKREK